MPPYDFWRLILGLLVLVFICSGLFPPGGVQVINSLDDLVCVILVVGFVVVCIIQAIRGDL